MVKKLATLAFCLGISSSSFAEPADMNVSLELWKRVLNNPQFEQTLHRAEVIDSMQMDVEDMTARIQRHNFVIRTTRGALSRGARLSSCEYRGHVSVIGGFTGTDLHVYFEEPSCFVNGGSRF